MELIGPFAAQTKPTQHAPEVVEVPVTVEPPAGTTPERPKSSRLRRYLAVASLAATSLMGANLATSQQEASASGGYPYDAAQPTGALSEFRLNGSSIDPNGFAYRNCTSYVAWKLGTLGIKVPYGANLGNANTWDDNAPRFGYAVDNTPRVGDAAVWDGGFGHVAYVESVNNKGTATPTDDTVTVSEYNYKPAYGGAYSTRSGLKANHYIHFLKGGQPMPQPGAPGPAPVPGNPTPQPGAPTRRPNHPVLYEFLHQNTNSGRSEIKKLDGQANYQNFAGGWVTPEGAHGGEDIDFVVGDIDRDGNPEGLSIMHQNTTSGYMEVRVLRGNGNFSDWVGGWVTPEGWHASNDVDFAMADYNHDGSPDLFVVLHRNTPSGKTEVKVLDGRAKFTKYIGGWVTPESLHNRNEVSFLAGDFNRDGHIDLYEIHHKNTPSHKTEVKILDGVANYQRWLGGWTTPEVERTSEDVDYALGSFATNQVLDVYEIHHQFTPSGHTEIKVLSGAQNYQAWIGGWVTPEGWHAGSDVKFAL